MPWSVLALLVVLVSGTSALAQQPPVLGADGAIFRLLAGSYGELFPRGTATAAESPVLALEVTQLNGSAELFLVPGTEAADSEDEVSLVLEDRSQVVYVLWEALHNGIHPVLRLTSFDGAEWSEVIEIISAPFASKGSPQLEVTREIATPAVDDAEGEERTILHLTWWEETAATSRKRYTPIILDNGEFLGYPPILDLGDFGPGPADDWEEISLGIANAVGIAPGDDSRSVVLGFLDDQSQRLVNLQLQVVPLALADYADKIHAEMILIGRKVLSMTAFAGQMSDKLLEHGDGIHIAVRAYMAERVAALIEATPDEELTEEGVDSLADKIHAEMILIGLKMEDNGLVRTGQVDILEIGPLASDQASRHMLGVSVASDRPAPEVGGPATLFLSASGREVLVAWDGAEDRIEYRESEGDGWSESAHIELGADLDREMAYRILERRVRDR